MNKSYWFSIVSPATAIGFAVALLFWLKCGRSIGMHQNKTPIAVILSLFTLHETAAAMAWLTHTEMRWSFVLMLTDYIVVKATLIAIILGTGYLAWRDGRLK